MNADEETPSRLTTDALVASLACSIAAIAPVLGADFARFKAIMLGQNLVLHRGENVMLLVRKLTAQIGAALTRADAALLLEGEWSEAVWREAFERAEDQAPKP